MAKIYDFVQVTAFEFSDIEPQYEDNFTHIGGHYYDFDELPYCELRDEDRRRIAMMLEHTAKDLHGFLIVCVERETVDYCDSVVTYNNDLRLTDAGLVTMGRQPVVDWTLATYEAQYAARGDSVGIPAGADSRRLHPPAPAL